MIRYPVKSKQIAENFVLFERTVVRVLRASSAFFVPDSLLFSPHLQPHLHSCSSACWWKVWRLEVLRLSRI